MIPDVEIARQIADYLLQIKAVKIQPQAPFTWASGWKSPIYCDNRVTLSFPHIRSFIKESLAKAITIQYPEVQVIAGVATAGIAPGALVADYLHLPFTYVRPEPKKHGTGKQMEGYLENSQKIVLVEDLISTGSSSIKALNAVRDAGHNVLGVAAIFSYGFPVAAENFRLAHCAFFSLSDYDHMLDIALQSGYIRQDELAMLKMWRQAPDKWTGV
jgi:orotate phosphoribosyltransferase